MVYYFKFEIEPAENNRYYGKIGYGEANIFVSDGNGFGDDIDTMIDVARAYIIAQTWVPLTLVAAHETNPPAPDWNKEQEELYQQAIQVGISGFFVASPTDDLPGGPSMILHTY